MHKVDPTVRERLWGEVAAEFQHAIAMFVTHGAKKEKGQSAKEALAFVLTLVAKDAYIAGLNRGYDMAAHVYAETLEVPRGK
jgi:hypothetical protein